MAVTAWAMAERHLDDLPWPVGLPLAPLSPPLSSGPWFWSCGQTNISCRMVNGKMVEVGKWPWQVSILFLGMYVCSGSIIHHHWVLTAAHCLQRSAGGPSWSGVFLSGLGVLVNLGSGNREHYPRQPSAQNPISVAIPGLTADLLLPGPADPRTRLTTP